MNYTAFKQLVIARHGNAAFALALWRNCSNHDEVRTEDIPSYAWCMLTYGLPLAVEAYIKAEQNR